MPNDDLDTLARLRGLLDVSRVVRDEEALPDMLRAIARTIAESLGYKVVVINLYRPAWDDFEVTTVHDYDHTAVEALMGTRGGWSEWEPLLDERFERKGAYFVRAGDYDWDNDMLALTPDIPISDDPDAWHPEDALFVPLSHADGHLLGIVSVDEPRVGDAPGRRRAGGAGGTGRARRARAAERTGGGPRQPLPGIAGASAAGLVEADRDALDRRGAAVVAEGIADALGFAKVSIDLPDPETGVLVPRCVVGWTVAEIARTRR